MAAARLAVQSSAAMAQLSSGRKMHEVMNQLAIITGQAELLAFRLGKDSDCQARIQSIIRTGYELAQLLRS